MHVVVGAIFFGLAAYFGVLLANVLSPMFAGEAEGIRTFAPPAAPVISAGAVLGAFIVTRAVAMDQIIIAALACVALAAILLVDARCGIIPDVCTLVPLAILLGFALWQREWWILISAAVPFLPFAILALITRGTGMGWGDVKLAALAGALLGAELSAVALALACLAAAIVGRAILKTQQPVPLGPYMVASIALALPIGLVR